MGRAYIRIDRIRIQALHRAALVSKVVKKGRGGEMPSWVWGGCKIPTPQNGKVALHRLSMDLGPSDDARQMAGDHANSSNSLWPAAKDRKGLMPRKSAEENAVGFSGLDPLDRGLKFTQITRLKNGQKKRRNQ